MTRTTTALLAAGLFFGCGGESPPAAKTAAEVPKAAPAPVEAAVKSPALPAPLQAKKTPPVKAADEPPGLDLPEDVEAVGGKPPELPIR